MSSAKSNRNTIIAIASLAAGLFYMAEPSLLAQAAPSASSQQTGGSTPQVPAPPPTANSEEESALKAFLSAPASDLNGKIAAGEDFLKKYPQSVYLPQAYSALTLAYLQAGKPDKGFETGEKELQLHPDDVETLALLSLTIPRVVNSKTPEPEKQLAKAEGYAKRAIEVTPTLAKPEGLTEQSFVVSKNTALSMAHGGLGLVYFRRGKFNEAIPELEQSIKIDPNPAPDPVNLYALALSDQKASHFDAAALVFTKCAEIAGSVQAACKEGAEQAKKQSATQLSAPK